MPKAPIVAASATLGKRTVGCQLEADDYVALCEEAEARKIAPGTLIRQILTRLSQQPNLINTVLGWRIDDRAP
jgi:predicted DNA-binding ribbon-helix-helix protein